MQCRFWKIFNLTWTTYFHFRTLLVCLPLVIANFHLGHGDGEDQLRPKQVENLQNCKVIDVACGSGDAQTLCITNNDSVWSWGDGDYGKLGRG